VLLRTIFKLKKKRYLGYDFLLGVSIMAWIDEI